MSRHKIFFWNRPDELAKVLKTLPELCPKKRRALRDGLIAATYEYLRERGAIDLYRERHAIGGELLKKIEAIELVLSLFPPNSDRISDSDRHRFERGLGVASGVEAHPSAYEIGMLHYPAAREISRRTMELKRQELVYWLETSDSFAVQNRALPEDERRVPARNDKTPERDLIKALLMLFAAVQDIPAFQVPIGNSADSNAFLRFARSVINEVVEDHAVLTDVAIRDHARAIKRAGVGR